MERHPAVYILASERNGTLYIGVTSNLSERIWNHKHDVMPGFSQRYGTHRLVYYQHHEEMLSAIAEEKRLKNWRRSWKLWLIEQHNPEWRDLAVDIGLPLDDSEPAK